MSKRIFYFFIVLSAIIMWSFSFPLIKIVLDNGVPPVTLAAMRAIVFIPILVFLLIKQGRKYIPVSKEDWLIYLSIGLFTIILPGILQNTGMMYTTASVSSIIQTSGPIFTIIFAIVILNESADKKKIVGSICALIGTIFLVISLDNNINLFDSSVYGNFLILLSGVSYAISSIITKKGLERKNPLQILGFSSLVGFIVLSVISSFERPLDVIINLSIETWFAIFLLVIFPSFIALLFWYEAMINEEISRLVIYVYLMPVFAVIFSYILIGEIISIQTLLFAVLIIVGVALAQKNSS
ncbi:MAG: DMT family transporter [Candidatus Thermoplasmatota archaeon]|nr:DMT family transporter [Candidatus Thermoplasmatota archaeon]